MPLNLEFFWGLTFLSWGYYYPEGDFCPDQSMVSVTVSAGHNPGVQHVSCVLLAHKDVVQHMPVFGAWVSPSGLIPGLLLEHRVCYGEVVFGTEFQ